MAKKTEICYFLQLHTSFPNALRAFTKLYHTLSQKGYLKIVKGLISWRVHSLTSGSVVDCSFNKNSYNSISVSRSSRTMERWSLIPLAWNLAGLYLQGPESSGIDAERHLGLGYKADATQLALSLRQVSLLERSHDVVRKLRTHGELLWRFSDPAKVPADALITRCVNGWNFR